MSDDPAGWQKDPTGRFDHRYWDGSRWTDHVATGGVSSTDAFTAPAPPVPASPGFPPPIPPVAGPMAAAPGASKGLLIGVGLLAVGAVVAAVVLLTGSDDVSERDRIHAQLATEMAQSGEISKEQAECLADAIIDEIGTDRLKKVDFSAAEPPEDIADDLISASVSNLSACDISAGDIFESGGADGFGSADGGAFGGDVDIPEGFEQQLAELYESSTGLSRTQAECLAGKVAAVIESGDLSEEQAMGEIFGYLDDCDIDLEDMTPS